MDRRAFLRAASIAGAGLAGLAGCSSPQEGVEGGADGGQPGIGTATDTETSTETEAGAETGTAQTGTDGGGGGTGTGDGGGGGGGNGGGGGGNGGGASAYEFLGRVEAWIGQSPAAIEGQENPTLQLQAGQEYEVTWINDDGVPHDFTIQDADGNNLQQTELLSEEGASATLTFTASEEMAQYICTVHPNTMVGTLEVSA
ncbi:twin-arginine translocation signal domain-containing protein (plasmid) [Halorarum halophilum]|uniref:Twin-arginine translocation signal domain-containing protein n=1 Tax=Halorarum halophilum TaxID=2743090 RepID=A0A7D5KA63_9EURY|nr:plastocyanin/azurin family copper-binding protein [Halobaculum halophilum]QLG29654.1 twin-arginine translocation signal domain-containing protein [Halobaculum halophilum]